MTSERMRLVGSMVAASFIGAALASVVTPNAVAQGGVNVVTTSQINLVDGSGGLRGILSGEDERGMASLALFDESGERRTVLAVGRDGTPVLELYDRAQIARAIVTVENDVPAVVVSGDGGRRAVLSTVGGGPTLAFQDGDRVRLDVGISEGDVPRLGLFGPTGQPQLALNVDEQGAPLLALRDGNGRSRASLAVVQDAAVLNLADEASARLVLGVAPDGNATLSFLDEGGNVTTRVP